MDRSQRLPLTVIEHTGVAGDQNLLRDYLAYSDPNTDQQQRANDMVRKHHALAVSRINHRNSALADALRPTPKFAVGGWTWVYNSASTIGEGVKAKTDVKVLKAKLALNWTGPYNVLAVGPCSSADNPDGSPLGDNLRHLDLLSDFGCSPACGDKTLQALCQRPRQQWHAQIPTGGADVVCAQQLFQEIPPVPRHSRRRFGSPPTT